MRSAADQLWNRLGRLAYGADYNPEQWNEATWIQDVELMTEAGVNLVSLAIFGWASLQPRPDEFDFSWLDRVMDLLSDAGIAVCLGTATASPPPWLSTMHPETLPVDRDGRRLWPGSRQHFCPSSPVFREHAARLVQRLAQRYGEHPALGAWHVGNEYGVHVSGCFCDVSADDFRRWLQARYGDLDALNRAWSTSFWSQRYGRWSEVLPPRLAPTFQNPAQQLDFFRFSSDALRECFENEVAVLRSVTPSVPVTTNFLGVWKPVDAFSWATREDFVSHDSYPDPADPEAAMGAAIAFDLMRGAGDGRRWLLMEQAPSAVNWRDCNQPKRPGLYRLWSWQAIAHGANGALSFQWRGSRGGAEMFHSAMVAQGGPDSPGFDAVAALGRELASVPLLASSVSEPAEVAIVMDWSSWWALELSSRPSSRVQLMPLLRAYYDPLWRATVPVELVHPATDLSRFRAVLAPNLYLLEDAWIESLTRFVQGGGQLVVGFFSGIVDANDVIRPGRFPGGLRDLLGVEIEQFWPLPEGERVGLRLASGTAGTGELWSEELRPTDADVVGRFEGGELDGCPALTRVRRGQGLAWYVSTLPDAPTLARILEEVLSLAGAQGLLKQPAVGVEATLRGTEHEQLLFLLNHGLESVSVEPAGDYESLLGAPVQAGTVFMDAQDVRILRRPRRAR